MAKKIEGLNEVLKSADGKDIMYTTPDNPMTIKTGFIVQMSGYKTDAMESMRVYDLSKKIYAAGDTLDIDDSDFALVKKIIEANPAGFYAITLAQVYRRLSV